MRDFLLLWAGTRVFLVLAVTFTILVIAMSGVGRTDVTFAIKAVAVAGLSTLCWVAGALCWMFDKPKEKMQDA